MDEEEPMLAGSRSTEPEITTAWAAGKIQTLLKQLYCGFEISDGGGEQTGVFAGWGRWGTDRIPLWKISDVFLAFIGGALHRSEFKTA